MAGKPPLRLLLALLAAALIPACVSDRYQGMSGLGYHATRYEARGYWRANGYEFGPEVDTVPRMEELAALYTPQQWDRLPKRHAGARHDDSVDIDGSAGGGSGSHGGSVSDYVRSRVSTPVAVPPPVRKTLPPLE